jgi:hypothetical protein
MEKTAKSNEYHHNGENILKACGLTKRSPVLWETYQFLLELWDGTPDGSRRVELLEGFLNDQEFSNRERAFLLYHLIDAAFRAGFDRGFTGTVDVLTPTQATEGGAKAVGHA